MTTLFEKMSEKVVEVQKKTVNSSHPLFTAYQDDFFKHDKEIILEDAQAGDKYIWIIKGNGCGTNLCRLNGSEILNHYIKLAGKESAYFLLEVSGINEGKIKSIDMDDALALAERIKESPDRKPRRVPLYTQLAEHLHTKERDLTSTLLSSEFNPYPGDKSLLKIERSIGGYSGLASAKITVLRPRIQQQDKYDSRTEKRVAEYYAPMNIQLSCDLLAKGPKYLHIQTTQNGYADIKEVSRRVFESAKKKLEQTVELNMD